MTTPLSNEQPININTRQEDSNDSPTSPHSRRRILLLSVGGTGVAALTALGLVLGVSKQHHTGEGDSNPKKPESTTSLPSESSSDQGNTVITNAVPGQVSSNDPFYKFSNQFINKMMTPDVPGSFQDLSKEVMGDNGPITQQEWFGDVYTDLGYFANQPFKLIEASKNPPGRALRQFIYQVNGNDQKSYDVIVQVGEENNRMVIDEVAPWESYLVHLDTPTASPHN